MTNLNIPESLKSYFGDEAIKNAVDALVDNLDGGNMPELGWEESR